MTQFMCVRVTLSLLIVSLMATWAQATEDSLPVPQEAPSAFGWMLPFSAYPQSFSSFTRPQQDGILSLQPSEAFARTRSVLKHFQVPEETDPQPALDYLHNRQTLAGLNAVLPVMDTKKIFRRFMRSEASLFSAFQDVDSRQTGDFAIQLAPTAPEAPLESGSFHQRLLSAKANPDSKPLAGLRIALDPGHQGGDVWDHRTGKMVSDHAGHKLSEAVLATQVSLLLEERFTALGAEVMLTRRRLGPVTDLPYEGMDIRPFALAELRDNTLTGWFQSLLASGPAGSSSLFAAFDQSPAVKGLLAVNENNRDKYFTLREDLAARARLIEAFDADIAVVIHFDTSSPANDPNGVGSVNYDAVKVYVSGSYEPSELGSREMRAFFARHLLDSFSWDASLKLGRSVVASMSKGLKLKFDNHGGGSSEEVEPGIFSRNLIVSRQTANRALTYVECLYYNDPTEFASLLKRNHPMMIDGVNMPYSDRLIQVADSLKDGVLGFVKNYSN